MNFYCLQHVPFETPGILAGHLQERGHSLQSIHLYRGDPLPSAKDLDGLVIMGGPMSIHDEDEFPWLREEKQLIAAAIRENKKVLGICLGAQLIAAVSGGRVYPNPCKEIGFWPVQWSEAAVRWTEAAIQRTAPAHQRRSPTDERSATAGKKLPGLRDLGSLPLLHWHGETFDLPPEAELLSSTGPCVNQAFLLGRHTLGLQFHPEVTPGIIRDMVAHEGHELVPAPYIQSAAAILQQPPDPAAGRLLDILLDAFLYS
jgi:GMP synthase-like glutamine amidotransferase